MNRLWGKCKGRSTEKRASVTGYGSRVTTLVPVSARMPPRTGRVHQVLPSDLKITKLFARPTSDSIEDGGLI